MNEKNIDEKEKCRLLMMALVDGEFTTEEKIELDTLINRFPDLQKEYKEFLILKEVTQTMKLKEPDQEIWLTYWQSIYNRIERNFAWLLFGIGAAVLLTYGLYALIINIWEATEFPLLIKFGIYVVMLGMVLLFISIIREKLFLWRNERYKEVLK